MVPQDLTGKTALVTGASRGIGRAIAVELGRRGALVAVHYGSARDAADETVRQITDNGGRAFAIGADLSALERIEELAQTLPAALAEQGERGLDILVNNAGIGSGNNLAATTPDQFDRLFAVNVRGLFFVTRTLQPLLRDNGRIINISSMVSVAAYPDTVAYAMTKAAVNSFTTSLAAEMGAKGITVNAVAPGATDTDFISELMKHPELVQKYTDAAALKRIGRATDIAQVVGFLASPAGGWVTGQIIQASGGMHL